MDDILERLKVACNGHPHAKIPWPHRLLHDAHDTIERLQRELADKEMMLHARYREELHHLQSTIACLQRERDEATKKLADVERMGWYCAAGPEYPDAKCERAEKAEKTIEHLKQDIDELVTKHSGLSASLQKAERERDEWKASERKAWEATAATISGLERERNEARVIIERWRGLLNEAANALGREHECLIVEICAALGGEG